MTVKTADMTGFLIASQSLLTEANPPIETLDGLTGKRFPNIFPAAGTDYATASTSSLPAACAHRCGQQIGLRDQAEDAPVGKTLPSLKHPPQ
ncbi:hypothetical protein [Mesorhizobium mediterraneum]|uniref:hypothetical protein n=1 Tax=Mesorhizobium mediterraneum TaxID=43617 RepID=UPI00177DDA24|nr:hypothetical protein [Mesorhizobium mediterraneum]